MPLSLISATSSHTRGLDARIFTFVQQRIKVVRILINRTIQSARYEVVSIGEIFLIIQAFKNARLNFVRCTTDCFQREKVTVAR